MTFREDLGRSWAAMKFAPLLIVTTAALAGCARLVRVVAVEHPHTRGVMTLLGVVILLVTVGFYGAQRFWLDAAFRGERYPIGDAARQTRRCFGRFFALGVCVVVAALPLFVVAAVINSASTVAGRAIFLLMTYAIDVILTFVVPALALTSTSVRRAFAISRGVVVQTGRASASYRFAPGIALLGLVYVLPNSSSVGSLSVVLAMFSAEVALWFKGAILAFYLRQPVVLGGGGDTR
jgi:hypothetical protein